MDSIDSNDTGSHVIELRSCPRCKTPIRTSLRYGNVIKQRLQDIEKVKIAAHGHPSEMTEVRENLRRRLDELSKISLGEDRERDLKRLARIVDRMAKGSGAVTTENQVTLMERYSRLCQRLNESLREPRDEPNSHIRFLGLPMQSELDNLRKRFMSFGVTERELRDINRELNRLNVHLELNLLLHNIKRFGAKLKQCYIGVIDTISHEVSQGNLIQEGRLGEMLKQLGAISQNYRFLSPLTEEETREIVSAMNLSQGRWYKCPQGHIYSIAGCGRPVQQAICPECRNVIGGRRYQPFEGNMEAPEMGGMQRTRQDRERLSRPNNSRKLL